MILYTEQQLNDAYQIDRKERTRLGIPFTTLEEFRPIYEKIMTQVYTDKK
tara:strand:- start:21262 stop:21411 length:150 start_codon:yes stop_codon:yes gene_type:complete